MKLLQRIDKSMIGILGHLGQCSLPHAVDRAEKVGQGCRSILRDDGSSLVEIALSCATLLCVFFGIFEFSLAMYSMHYVAAVARDASRYAMVNGSACTAMPDCGFTDTNTTLQNYVTNNESYPGIDTSKLTVTSSWFYVVPPVTQNPTWTPCGVGSTCNAPGNLVQVTVTYPFILSIPFWRSTTLNIRSTSRMVISQ
jgi:Flp pilus assembly protein TadG